MIEIVHIDSLHLLTTGDNSLVYNKLTYNVGVSPLGVVRL